MEENRNQHIESESNEAIDFGKLRMIIRNNLIWIILIFITTNAASYIFIRYTKDLYESVSEIKLDIKQDATEFGFRDFAPDQNIKMISGEIENIQSKLFLNSIIDSLNIQVSYYSIGQVLNFELYNSSPFVVNAELTQSSYYNNPIFIEALNDYQYELRFSNNDKKVTGQFGKPLHFDGGALIVNKKKNATFERSINYSFIINSRDRLLQYLTSNLTVEPLNLNANTIRVSFRDNNPNKAQALVNKIDSLYLQYSNEQKNRANKQKIDWLTNELMQIENKMESFEDYFENFILENKTNNVEKDISVTIEQIHAVDSQRFELTRRTQDITIAIEALLSNQELPAILQNAGSLDFIKKNLEQLQLLMLEMEKIKMSYNEDTYVYTRKQQELQSLQRDLLKQLTDLKTSYQKKLADLGRAKARLESEFVNMPDKSTQFTKNQRFYKLYEEFYLTLMQNKSQFEIAQAGSTPEFKILATATLPNAPISPSKAIIFGIGFVAGIVLNIFFIGVLYLINNKITGTSELERLIHIPLLGVVPVLRKTDSMLHVLQQPKSIVSEAIRTLRTNLDFFGLHAHDKKVITISSTVSGEGKSFIAMNLGGVFALSKKKVILIDLDMRKHKENLPVSNEDPSRGVSTILIKKHTWKDCILETPIESLHFISAGPQPPNPSELLLNGEFEGLINELKNHYDYIILDTPPVGLVTDGIMAMKRSDISIYIFRANYSKKEFLHNLNRIIRINKVSSITTLLNALPVSSETYGYGYYEDNSKGSRLKSIFRKRV